MFVNVKVIQSVIVMISHSPVTRGQVLQECFFLIEKPGFNVALIAGIYVYM